MKLEGGCYCGKVRYVANGDPVEGAMSLPRMPIYQRRLSKRVPSDAPDGFSYVKGMPKEFRRSDLESAVTREFCAECGTHLTTRRPGLSAVILKAGTLDDPALFGSPQMAIYTVDKQAFHHIADGLPTLRAAAETMTRHLLCGCP